MSDATFAERRDAARAALGVTGDDSTTPLRPILREHNLSTYPLVALGMLAIVDGFQAYAFNVLTPEISRALGLSLGAIAAARTLAFLATVLAPLPMAALAQRRASRAALCVVTGIAWSVITLYTGFVTSVLALIAVLVLDGVSTGSVYALHAPLVVDSYPPQARLRVLSGYQSFQALGQVIAPLFVAVFAGPLNLTWRGVFLAMGAVSLASSVFALRLRDPGPTGIETHTAELGFFEITRRVLLIPTVKRVAVGFFFIGVLLIPFQTFLASFLDDEWGLGPGARGSFFAFIAALSIAGLFPYARFAQAAFNDDPARVLRIAGGSLGVAVTLFGLGALAPVFALVVVFFSVGYVFLVLTTPGLNAALLSVVDAPYRAHASAITGVFAASGSIIGVLFLSGIDTRFGVAGSIVALVVPGVIAGTIVFSAHKLIDSDLDRMIDEILEAEDVRAVEESGGRLPMLTCRGINFSYGQLQVLFDVDFTVDDGEMVALLGTNGAGKSTLLKVISGIGLPSAGTVRLRGRDITYLDAERRVPLGIIQTPGGRSVFGPLDVVENLRAFGYTLGRDRKRIDEAIELCFETFPRLKERRGSLAATLSGGEQQMVGLSKALILQPQLLLIDELSLGLAPIIVGQLLDTVRRINANGTAVVLVEQSVNIALSLVEHAYFMEKGEMRFDGRAKDLLARDDLLRAVFLEGATKAGAR